MYFQEDRGIFEVLLCFQQDRGVHDIMSDGGPLVSTTSWDHPSFFMLCMTNINFLSDSGRANVGAGTFRPAAETYIVRVYY